METLTGQNAQRADCNFHGAFSSKSEPGIEYTYLSVRVLGWNTVGLWSSWED